MVVRFFLWALVVGCWCYGAARPNIVFLISEDNSKHYLKLFDEMGAPAPNIEKLAAKGIVFDHAFSNGAVCSVARTTLATGCYAPRIGGQYHRRYALAELPADRALFPKVLREAGYYTANNAKTDYNVQGPGVNGAWHESSGKASWRKRQPGQPFFYKQSFALCHESCMHFPESDVKKQPTQTNPATVKVPACYPDTPLFRYSIARYLDKMADVDRVIGKVVDQLDADGLLDDTFIFYFGDHGGVLPGSKGYAWERGLHVPLVVYVPKNFTHLSPYARGSRAQGFVSFIDFGPTALKLAGIDTPDYMDGQPFLGAGIDEAAVEARDTAFGYADRFDEKYDLVRTIRKGKYKYVRSYQPFNFDGIFNEYRYRQAAYREWWSLYQAGKLSGPPAQFFEARPAEALYDVEADPWETKNLADDPNLAGILRELRNLQTQTAKSWPDLSFFPESVMVKEALTDAVDYGQGQKARIGKLVDVANLQLRQPAEAQADLAAAQQSADAMLRYWGWIAAASHGKAAAGFADSAKSAAATDPVPLVRVRAAEFLGLTGAGDPAPAIRDVLQTTTDPLEILITQNTAVMLQDGAAKIELKLKTADINRDEYLMNLRTNYLTGSKLWASPRKPPKK